MTTLRAICPTCGEQELPVSEGQVLRVAGQGAYVVWRCPTCRRQVNRKVNEPTVQVCRAAGMEYGAWNVALHGLEPITEEEVDALTQALTGIDLRAMDELEEP